MDIVVFVTFVVDVAFVVVVVLLSLLFCMYWMKVYLPTVFFFFDFAKREDLTDAKINCVVDGSIIYIQFFFSVSQLFMKKCRLPNLNPGPGLFKESCVQRIKRKIIIMLHILKKD